MFTDRRVWICKCSDFTHPVNNFAWVKLQLKLRFPTSFLHSTSTEESHKGSLNAWQSFSNLEDYSSRLKRKCDSAMELKYVMKIHKTLKNMFLIFKLKFLLDFISIINYLMPYTDCKNIKLKTIFTKNYFSMFVGYLLFQEFTYHKHIFFKLIYRFCTIIFMLAKFAHIFIYFFFFFLTISLLYFFISTCIY